jgi:tetratricopeptide (TPR) repeat protein
MDPLPSDAVFAAFSRIEEAPRAERGALLDALDPSLRDDVASLLDSHDHAGGFLALPEGPPPGTGGAVGPYRLLNEIGRGGMGVVYRATRTDGEFERDVAIKIGAGGYFGPEAERRFIRERQILAQLDHPHIVRLIDGGIAGGHRYFVMDLAEGVPITEDCARRGLELPARLRLFCDVCAAIQYAHQRLVLHRDLKPANIIVTPHGVVKVLDFGIAQMLDATAGAARTTIAHPLSYGCASPEQLRGESLSLASDVYALGVLLYELASGVNPQFREGDTFEDTFRRVMDGTMPAPGRITRGVPHDLDAIVLKAMARVPADRYGSVAELQADVERLLDGRPVLARTPSAVYVLGRFVQRNKALTAAVALLFVALAAGVGAYAYQARIERRRFDDARTLVHTVIFDIQPKMENIAGTLPLRQTLIESTMRYLEAVSADAGTNVDLLLELSNAYQQLARVRGDITTSTMGDAASATERFRKSEALMARAVAAAPTNPAVLKDAAVLHGRLGGFENTQGRSDEAFRHARLAVEFAERNVAGRPGEFDAREVFAVSVYALAISTPQENWQARVDSFQRANALYRTLASERTDKEGLVRNVIGTDRFLGSLYRDKRDFTRAQEHGARALEASERLLARRPADPALQLEVASDAGLLGVYLDAVDRLDDGRRHYERAIDLTERLLVEDAANARGRILLGEAARNFAANRLRAGQPTEARRWATRAVGVYESMQQANQLPSSLQWRFAGALATLGDVERADHQASRACANYRRAVELYDASDRQAPLVDLLKADADRTRANHTACQAAVPSGRR